MLCCTVRTVLFSMIDLQLYRLRIGYYNLTRICKLSNHHITGSTDDISHFTGFHSITSLLYILIYILYTIYSLTITLALLIESLELKTKFYRKISINYSRVFCHDTLGSWYLSVVSLCSSLALLPIFVL